MSSIDLSIQQLRQAADLKEEISALENQLSKLLGSTTTVTAPGPKKSGMSAAGRARVAAAAKARWAKIKAAKPVVKAAVKPVSPVPKKKGGISAAGRARIAAAAKARWAKVKAAGKKSL